MPRSVLHALSIWAWPGKKLREGSGLQSVVPISGHDVNVGMPHGLTGCSTIVHREVESDGMVTHFEQCFQASRQTKTLGVFVVLQIKNAHYVTPRNDQGMSGRDWVLVCNGEGVRSPGYLWLPQMAKGTGGHAIYLITLNSSVARD
jgi:hypothetical protein